MKKKTLTHNLILTISLTLSATFLLIFLSFHYVIRDYVNQITRDAMQSHFTILDSVNKNQKIPDIPINDNTFVWSQYAIFDQNYQTLFTSEDHNKKGGAIVTYLNQNNRLKASEDKLGILVTLSKKTYLVRTKYYEGAFDDGIIAPSKKNKRKTYLVLAFIDVTMIQRVVNRINLVLVGILFATLIPLLLMLQRTLSGVGQSIDAVKQYIARLWRDQEPSQMKTQKVIFAEFDDLLAESHEMANRIKQAEESQRQFFQNASHELRTPLMSIQGYTEALQEGVIPKEQALPILLSESHKMKRLVDDMIFLSRLDSHQHTNNETVTLATLAKECADYFAPIISQHHLAFFCQIDDDELVVRGDNDRLQRALANIMTNALRYAKSQIVLSYKQGMLTLSNDGPAISKEELPHLFERFYKGDRGQTGIGLAMTKEILQQHQATIDVSSDTKKTSFIIHFQSQHSQDDKGSQ